MQTHPSAAKKKIFLTGGNGVVGQALVRRLGADRFVFLRHSNAIKPANAEIVAGDITQPRLGLSKRDHADLAKRISAVVHCAALTNLQAPAENTLTTNVQGTQNIIALAEQAETPLYQVSTAFVSDRVGRGGLNTRSAYRDSKRVAEDLVRQSNLPWAIIRPSIIVGNSATGEMAQFQGFHSLVACFLKGKIPIIPATSTSVCDFVPQDLVADAMAAILNAGEFGQEYWITAGSRALPVTRMLQLIDVFAARQGRALKPLRIIDPDAVSRLFLPVFLPTLPKGARLRMEQLFKYAEYIDVHEPLPSSLPMLAMTSELDLTLSPETLFLRNMQYWADRTGYSRTNALAA